MVRLSLSNKEVSEAQTGLNSFLFVVSLPSLFVSTDLIVAAVYCVEGADRETTLSTQIHA